MEIGTITAFGVYDTAKRYSPRQKSTQFRPVVVFEVSYYTSGTGTAMIDDRKYDIHPGSLAFCKPGQIRRGIFPFSCYYIRFSVPKNSELYEPLMNTPDFYRIIDNTALHDLFETLFRHLFDYGYSEKSLFVKAKLLELIFFLLRDAETNRKCDRVKGQSIYPSIQTAIRYMETNFQNQLTTADLAGVSGYSTNYFNSTFIRIMGKSPMRYLLDIRIRHAKYLLAQTQKKTSEIALECGFSTQSYFITTFKRETHSTPNQYKKSIEAQFRASDENAGSEPLPG